MCKKKNDKTVEKSQKKIFPCKKLIEGNQYESKKIFWKEKYFFPKHCS